MPSQAERARVLQLLRKHGWNATSFQILEEGFSYAFTGDGEACVAYADTGSAWVVAGAPICALEALTEVTAWFIDRAREARRRVSFFAVEERFCSATKLPSIRVGEQPSWDPTTWEASLASPSARSLREQLRRARAKGVVARRVDASEVTDPGAPMRRAIETLIMRWLGSRGMAPMGFLVDVQPFAFAEERRYVVAERAGRVVAFLAVVPVFARGGWFIEDFVRDPDAPNGTPELLVDFAMRGLAAEGSHYATMGLAPLAGAISGWLRFAREQTRALYDFEGLRAFKAKLRPHAWEPIDLAYPAGASPNAALFDVLAAFARGSLTRFGIETLLLGPAIVVRALAVLLVPWTALLALAPERFFPRPWVKPAWIAFDAVLAVLLFALASKWRRALGRLLAAAVALDALVTWVEALVWNVPRAHGVLDWAVIAAGCIAPTIASFILAGALGHREWMKEGPPRAP